jgi:hypothetical protein
VGVRELPGKPVRRADARSVGNMIDTGQLVAMISSATDVVPPARPRGRNNGHVKDFGEGRQCAAAGCHTVLSRYNGGHLCWPHDDSARSTADRRPTVTTGQPPRIR